MLLLNPPLKGKSFVRRRPLVLLLIDRRVERMGEETGLPPHSLLGRATTQNQSLRSAYLFLPGLGFGLALRR